VSHYSLIYGLNVELNKAIPGVACSPLRPSSVDVQISFGLMPTWLDEHQFSKTVWYASPEPEPGAEPRLMIWKLANGYYQVHYADGTEFLISQACSEIWATWPTQTLSLEDTATYLLGPVLGFVLLLRGCTCLHASAFVIDNQAVALVGPAGAGKSTTAAAFAERGYTILAEDVVTLDDRESRFLVHPAYPCIRLWPAAVKALYGEYSDLPRLTPTWEKRYLDLTGYRSGFQTEPLPLAAIYLLGERREEASAPAIRELSQSEALISLIANTYATYLMDKKMRAREFELLGRVIRGVPLRKVVPHTNPAHLEKLCELITQDARQTMNSELAPFGQSRQHV
jgi:hypothetical protein